MSLYVNRIRYKGMTPTLGASSGVINKAVINGVDFWDDNYDPTPPTPPAHDYSQDYFTIESLEDGNDISFIKGTRNVPNITFYYSTDNGTTWGSHNDSKGWTLNTGDKLMMKINTERLAYGMDTSNAWRFNSSKTFIVYGNVLSLIWGDDFIGKTTFYKQQSYSSNNYAFAELFYTSKIVSAENLVLPVMTLEQYCYNYMFGFCTSLTTGPVLPALTLVQYCYQYMFYGCTSLNKVICLATDISAGNCTNLWFGGSGVAATGTFYKNPAMTSTWPSGTSGVPNGWTLVNYDI